LFQVLSDVCIVHKVETFGVVPGVEFAMSLGKSANEGYVEFVVFIDGVFPASGSSEDILFGLFVLKVGQF